LNRDLSLTELAEVINISPTYFGEFIQTGGGSFTTPVCDSTAGGTGEMLSKTD